jgi:hypothetical protein
MMSLWNNRSNLQIATKPEDLSEGLFGDIFLYVFEILPYLHAHSIFPDWKLRAKYYGMATDGLVIPGALDIAYDIVPGPKKVRNLVSLREHHRHALGNDWHGLSALWNAYFRIPRRITDKADTFGSLSDTIGIHYRGNDKHAAYWDTNPVNHGEYLSIIQDLTAERPEFSRIFLATDDFEFYTFLKGNLSVEIINLGHVGFHKIATSREAAAEKMDRAMLDCVLLSRCGVVLQTSSALSSFAKILNPDLEIYRVAASKAHAHVPYFPVAFVPVYQSRSSKVSALVERLTADDWTQSAIAEMFKDPFVSRAHWPPFIRLIYSSIRKIPGLAWTWRIPALVASISRRLRSLRQILRGVGH